MKKHSTFNIQRPTSNQTGRARGCGRLKVEGWVLQVSRLLLLPALFVFAVSARGQSAATMTIQVNQPGAVVSSNLFGIFFEEINCAGEGGIYAEMVRNRAFYSASSALFWTLVTQGSAAGTMTVDATQPLNTN